jgi:hypothetical protein
MKTTIALSVLALIAGPAFRPSGGDRAPDEAAALVKALARSKVSLTDGVRQVSKGAEEALSAKYEFDRSGQLSLSVYTAERGLKQDAEHNVLKEYTGSPEKPAWTPELEVFADVPHVARSAQQHALLALSGRSLLDFVAQAEKEDKGTLLSITPVLRGREGSIRVEYVSGDEIVESSFPLHAEDDEESGEGH